MPRFLKRGGTVGAVPYQIIYGEKESLIAECRILDAKWYGIFAKAGMKKTFKIYMKRDPEI